MLEASSTDDQIFGLLESTLKMPLKKTQDDDSFR